MNLVIGNTSQLSHYFPEDYIKISSRNIDFDYLRSNRWDSVYITFAEQRIYDSAIDYITPNYLYTLDIIKELLPLSNKIVCYGSCELWNNLSGYISINTEPNFFPIAKEYTISKLLLWNKIKEFRNENSDFYKVIMLHPFYFNSVHRSEYFLFGRIFHSILNKEKIRVGNLNFYRDVVHTNFVVKKSIEATSDAVVGSGDLVNIRSFIKDLYKLNCMKFDEYVEEYSEVKGKEKLIMADVPYRYNYEQLLADTQNDLEEHKRKHG